MKWISLGALFCFFVLTVLEKGYFRHVGNKREVYGVFVEDASVSRLTVDTQDVLNDESVQILASKTMNLLLNYRPGQAEKHLVTNELKSAFISDSAYEAFADRFLYWSDREFRVNNISIKESIVTDEEIIPIPMTGGMRMWHFTTSIPMVNRGVGGTGMTIMKAKVSIIYAGPEVGIGINDIELYNR